MRPGQSNQSDFSQQENAGELHRPGHGNDLIELHSHSESCDGVIREIEGAYPEAAYCRSPVDIVGYADRRLSHEPVPHPQNRCVQRKIDTQVDCQIEKTPLPPGGLSGCVVRMLPKWTRISDQSPNQQSSSILPTRLFQPIKLAQSVRKRTDS